MDEAAINAAVRVLAAATRTGQRLVALPDTSKPATVAEALAIQHRLVAASGRAVAGYKVATDASGAAMYGAIYADDCHPSPAAIDAARYPLLGIEGEIAYRFLVDLPPRDLRYDRSELLRVLQPFPAIEIVDSRYTDYSGTPVLDRLADRMSNGAMILGMATGPSRDFDTIGVKLTIDGVTRIDQSGGHLRRDPLLPALDFIHAVQGSRGFQAGQFITTGTFTGLLFGQPGQMVEVGFRDFGSVSVSFEPVGATSIKV